MKVITISGAHSNIGKTTVVERLLGIFKGWSCLKVTTLHNGLCPTGRDCGACDKLSSRFSIVSDKEIIEKPNKDTWRFKKAGAKDVLWLRAKPEGLRQGLKQALFKMRSARGIIIEGTSILKYLKPDLAIFVKRDNSLLKDSAKEILKKVDLILTL
ncbi:MAG: hypothetical protein Q8R31_02205 [Candidatus Omnitrophota bacterium]|nr:hypothetical protein [Candidatus Omnitrophota bacterium]